MAFPEESNSTSSIEVARHATNVNSSEGRPSKAARPLAGSGGSCGSNQPLAAPSCVQTDRTDPYPADLTCGAVPTSGMTPQQRPIIVELCAGTAMLSRCFKEREFGVLAVDHQSNRFVPLAEICSLDLTKDYTWEFLHHLLEHYPIKFIHAAPPCGTASRAREIRLSGRCPQPLRSEAEPEDLSSLTGEDLDRVKAANAIYAGISKLLLKATELHITWTVESRTQLAAYCGTQASW